MGNLPVIHEVGTSFVSLGDVITGNPKRAEERWETYLEESVLGSMAAGIVEACDPDSKPGEAKKYFKGLGRATGKAVLGGGLLRDVPFFNELAVCGEALGDVIGGGDTKSAEKRFETYPENSLIGAAVGAIVATNAGDEEQAEKCAEGCRKAAFRFGVTAAGLAVTVATGGLAAPYGVAASVATGAAVGGTTGAASTALVQVIDKGKVDDAGAVIGNGLFGGFVGGVSDGIAAKRAASKAKAQANRPARQRANSESLSTSSEAEFFPQRPSTTKQRDSFSFEGGKAKRHSEIPDVWSPKDAGKKADIKAANEAARVDIQESVKNCSRRTRPGKTSVIQDAEGNAYGTSSVRGPKSQAKLRDTLGSKQSRVLDSIHEEVRGVGHGNCAEQVAVNNTRYFRQKTGEKLFAKKSEIKEQAFAPAKGVKGVYNVPVKPCGSCQPVLKEFRISHGATQALPLKCDRMAQMIASGLTVGCKACQHCQEKKE